jgi:hypothetical protein
MKKARSPLAPPGLSTETTPARVRALASAALVLVFVACGAAGAGAQVGPAARARRSQPQTAGQRESPAEADKDEGEGESESEPEREGARSRVTDPAAIMRGARFVYVRSDSAFVSGSEVEDSLRKRKEFQAWGMVITRNPSDADLVVVITRKLFTRRFTFSVVDPRTMEVVASGKTRSVLFGKKIADKVAEKFANRVKAVRPYP